MPELVRKYDSVVRGLSLEVVREWSPEVVAQAMELVMRVQGGFEVGHRYYLDGLACATLWRSKR